MKVIYLSENMEVGEIETYLMKNQNKYGAMSALNEKIELVTTEHVTDYHVSKGENDKKLLCFTSPQIKGALSYITNKLTTEKGLVFKPVNDKMYLKISDEQFQNLPKNQKLHLSVNVYGVFTQSSSNLSFLQMELTTFKSYALVNFDRNDGFQENDNATW
jgi:hypothetical protein